MTRNILVFANGRKLYGRKKLLLDTVIDRLKALGHKLEIHSFANDAEAEILCSKFYAINNFQQLVIAGGDGSVNTILRNWQRHDIPLAIIPLGTCNMLARECGYTKDVDLVTKIIDQMQCKNFYSGKANNKLFVTVAGCGLDSVIAQKINWQWKRYLGRVYITTLLIKELLQRKSAVINIAIDGREPTQVSTLLLAKGRYYAGKFYFAPKASIFDPTLYILFYKHTSLWDEMKKVIALFTNNAYRAKGVTVMPVQQVEIKSTAPVQLDGDVRLTAPVTLTIDQQPYLVCVDKSMC